MTHDWSLILLKHTALKMSLSLISSFSFPLLFHCPFKTCLTLRYLLQRIYPVFLSYTVQQPELFRLEFLSQKDLTRFKKCTRKSRSLSSLILKSLLRQAALYYVKLLWHRSRDVVWILGRQITIFKNAKQTNLKGLIQNITTIALKR